MVAGNKKLKICDDYEVREGEDARMTGWGGDGSKVVIEKLSLMVTFVQEMWQKGNGEGDICRCELSTCLYT